MVYLRNLIPEEKMGNAPLDMQQYKKVFGTCRIPGETVDSLEYNPTSKHIAVVHNNHVSGILIVSLYLAYYIVLTHSSGFELMLLTAKVLS